MPSFGSACSAIGEPSARPASAVLGKTPGKDAAAGKPTYPSLYGLDESRRRARASLEQALRALQAAGLGGQLPAIAEWVVSRRN